MAPNHSVASRGAATTTNGLQAQPVPGAGLSCAFGASLPSHLGPTPVTRDGELRTTFISGQQSQSTMMLSLGRAAAQQCTSCLLLEGVLPPVVAAQQQGQEPQTGPCPDPELLSAMLAALSAAPPASAELADCAAALACMLTCKTCGGPCSKQQQQRLCCKGAVMAVANALRASLACTSAPHFSPAGPPPLPPVWLPPLVHVLSMLVVGAPSLEVVSCLADDGWPMIKAVLARSPRDRQVLACVCTSLTALFPAWAAPLPPSSSAAKPGAALQAEALVVVANLAGANAQHGHLDTARTAAWALVRMARCAAAVPPTPPDRAAHQLWVMLTGQVILIVMDILATVGKQDEALAKHCLAYIETVARACARGGPPAAVAAGGDGSATQFLRDALALAGAVAKQSPDLRLQVAALRCMDALLAHPQLAGLLADEETVGALLRTTSLARFTPGSNPKDVALSQVYGMCVLARLLTPDVSLAPSTAASIAPEVHASVGAVVSFLAQSSAAQSSGMLQPWQLEEATHEVELGGGCRLGPHCLASHEALDERPAAAAGVAGGLMIAMAEACATVLAWCGRIGHARAGVGAADAHGTTVLHRLCAAGLTEAALAFVRVAGSALDLGKVDGAGLTASDVAGRRGHGHLTEQLRSAAAAAADAASRATTARPEGMDVPGSALAIWPGPARTDPPPAKSAALMSPATRASAAALEEGSGLVAAATGGGAGGAGSSAFQVNTVALSQLINSIANGSAPFPAASLPAWLSAGVAAAVSAQEETMAARGGGSGGGSTGHPLRAEDLALISDAESLLSDARLSSAAAGKPPAAPGSTTAAALASELGAGTGNGSDGADSSTPPSSARQPSKHLWLGNLSTKLPRSVLKAVFEHFGAVEDVVTFPGRMYAFVNFKNPEDAEDAANALNDREVPPLTGSRRLVVKFRPSKKALGKSADGPGADAAAAAAAAAAGSGGAATPSTTAAGTPTTEVSAVAGADASFAAFLAPGKPMVAAVPPESPDAASDSGSESQDSGSGLDGGGNSGRRGGQTSDSAAVLCSGLGVSSSAGDVTGSISSCSGLDREESPGAPSAEGVPSRHLWLGNVPLRPSKQAIEALFGEYGQLESVRVFPGKTFAFINYVEMEHALAAKAALDGQTVQAVCGSKPLAVRFQKEGPAYPSHSPSPDDGLTSDSVSVVPSSAATATTAGGSNSAKLGMGSPTPVDLSGALRPQTPPAAPGATVTTVPASALAGGATQLAQQGQPASRGTKSAAGGLAADKNALSQLMNLAGLGGLSKLLDDDLPPEPAINLSNRLNPNNIHFDKELAARYKRMTKAEKEALWAQDRLMQQMASSNAAAALLAATGVPGVAPGLLDPRLTVAALGIPPGGAADALAAAQLQQAAAAAAMAAGNHNSGGGRGGAKSLQSLIAANAASAAMLLQAQQAQQALAVLQTAGGAGKQPNSAAALQLALLQLQQQQQQQAAAAAAAATTTSPASHLGSFARAGNMGANAPHERHAGSLAGFTGGAVSGAQLSPEALLSLMGGGGSMAGTSASLHPSSAGSLNGLNSQLLGLGGSGVGVGGGPPPGGALHSSALLAAQMQQLMLGSHPPQSAPPQQLLPGYAQSVGRGDGGGMYGAANSGLRADSAAAFLQAQLQLQQQLTQQHSGLPPVKQLPSSFLCPLSGQVMLDPVVAADGVTYERSAILAWLQQHSVSPITRHALANKFLAPNHSLRAAVLAEVSHSSRGGATYGA